MFAKDSSVLNEVLNVFLIESLRV